MSNIENYHPFFDEFFLDRPFRKELHNLGRVMRTDIKETEQGYEFKVEVPGLAKKDLTIGLEKGYLTVTANQKESAEDETAENYLRRERVCQTCSRSFYVGEVDESAISASLEHGILTINLPKESKPTKKTISIK